MRSILNRTGSKDLLEVKGVPTMLFDGKCINKKNPLSLYTHSRGQLLLFLAEMKLKGNVMFQESLTNCNLVGRSAI